MKKQDTGKIDGTDGTVKKEKFDRQYDAIHSRLSYERGFASYCNNELMFIAGVLDMLVLIDTGDQWESKGDNLAFVLMEARNRAEALCDII